MRILEYSDLDTSRVRPQYEKVRQRLEADDLRSADLKKLEGGLYRAKLDHTNRLIVKLMRHQGERVALALEVVLNHAYDRSRFLRGARIDEEKIPAMGVRRMAALGFEHYLEATELIERALAWSRGFSEPVEEAEESAVEVERPRAAGRQLGLFEEWEKGR